jgi:ABC-type antimicrobial peptide transport system permease subunit
VGGVVTEAAILVAVGSLVGVGLVFLVAPAMEGLVYGRSPLDPAMLVGAPALLLLVGLGAAVLPARRAATVDPSEALRLE